jgi:hypothetical protein
MAQITHTVDEDGHYRQIVTPHTLRNVLASSGYGYTRPACFGPDDEWDAGADDDRPSPCCP